MQKLQHLELATLNEMLIKHKGYYEAMLNVTSTKRQLAAGQNLISIIQQEIDSRQVNNALSAPVPIVSQTPSISQANSIPNSPNI